MDGSEIVELCDEKGEWIKTTLNEALFICNTCDYDIEKYVRKVEGSVDNGVTWKTMHKEELMEFSMAVFGAMKWRIKES